jgi:hypothetical protein
VRRYGRHLRLLPVLGDRLKRCGLSDVWLLKTNISTYAFVQDAVGQEVYGNLGHDGTDLVAFGTGGGLAAVSALDICIPSIRSTQLNDLTSSPVKRHFICSEPDLWTDSSYQFSLLDSHNDYPVSSPDLMVNHRPLLIREPLFNYVGFYALTVICVKNTIF